MTKSEIFKAAHKLAKTFEGNYRACFALALREVRKSNVIITKSDMCFGDLLFPSTKITAIEAKRRKAIDAKMAELKRNNQNTISLGLWV